MPPTTTHVSDSPSREVTARPGQVVAAAAIARLRRSGYPSLRHVSCEVQNGVLMLRGGVSSFFLKQIAQALLRDLAVPFELDNQLTVAPSCPIGAAHNVSFALQ